MIPVVPRPASVAVRAPKALRLGDGTAVVLDDPSLGGLARRFTEDLSRDGTVVARVQEPLGDGGVGRAAEPVGATIRVVLSVDADADAAVAATVGVSPSGADPADERYHLVVDDHGVTVQATAPEGLWRGLTTLRQLIAAAPRASGAPVLDAIEVRDAPRYAWRGLSLDVVRSFFGPAEVKRVIDVLSLHKLNVLHLHLTDDQGWRIEIPGRPALTEIGGRGAVGDRPGGSYTRAEFADLVHYAADRFVTVVPEIDMPGHAAAVIAAHPELSARSAADETWPPANVLDPDHPGVADFVGEVIGALAEVTPGPYLHIGGDEAFGLAAEAYRRFVDAARGLVLAAGKRPVSWQEAAGTGVGPADVVQHWLTFGEPLDSLLLAGDLDQLEHLEHLQLPDGIDLPAELLPVIAETVRHGRADIARAVERGARVLLSPASHLYLDRPYADAPTDLAQRGRRDRLGLAVYPRMTIEESFAWDPGTALDLPDEAVAGVEAAIWCETIETSGELEFMLLPRLAGVAERAWSAPPGATWGEYRIRLGAQSTIWAAQGWQYLTSSLVDWAPPA